MVTSDLLVVFSRQSGHISNILLVYIDLCQVWKVK